MLPIRACQITKLGWGMASTKLMRVLLVESDVAEVKRIHTALSAANSQSVRLLSVASVEEAHQTIAADEYDVILLSVHGARCLENIKYVRAAVPTAAIIAISETENDQLAMDALHSGAQDCLIRAQITPQLLSRAARYALERVRTQEQLLYVAQYDSVTELPNRVLFRDRLTQALLHAQRNSTRLAVMFLDLDYFKSVNDMLGHDAGDQLLREVSSRIKAQIRKGDTLARMGGDEFTIILEDMQDISDAGTVSQKIIDAMSRAFVLQGEEFFITTSIGIAAYPLCGIEPAQLIKNADAALYHAKDNGRGCYRYYVPEMNKVAADRLKTVTQLRHAIARNEFTLYYQPQIDPATGAVGGVEALLRWQHPDRGVVMPGEFISLLEDTGLIVGVGEWAMRAAFAQQRTWSEAGFEDLCVAVNLSARQFRQKDFVSSVARLIEETGANARCLQLELTESLLVENVGMVVATLRALHTLGVRFSIDDFGTGYSSLSYLRQFPLHSLKIDRSFLKSVAMDDDAAIVSAIISLGHSLGMKVVAEGAETAQQIAFLKGQGCDWVQGYYYAKPMAAAEFEVWLRARDRVIPSSNVMALGA